MSDFDNATNEEALLQEQKEERKRKRKEHQLAVEQGLAEKVRKQLPVGYTCKICGAKNEHAIYECPSKNKVAKDVDTVQESSKQSKKSKTKEMDDVSTSGAQSNEVSSKKDKHRATKKKSISEEEDDVGVSAVDEMNKDGKEAYARQAVAATKATAKTIVKSSDLSTVAEKASSSTPKQVYISGLPFDMTVGKLLALFQEKGLDKDLKQPFGIHIVCFPDKPGKCKGVAFCTFTSLSGAQRCCNLLEGIVLPKADGTPGKSLHAEVNERQQAVEWVPPVPGHNSDSHSVPKTVSKSVPTTSEGGVKMKRCYRCGSSEHEPKDCTNDRVCYRCLATDHLSVNCPRKKGYSGNAHSTTTAAQNFQKKDTSIHSSNHSERTNTTGKSNMKSFGTGVRDLTSQSTGKGLPAPTNKKIIFDD